MRNATIICNEPDTVCMVIYRNDFLTVRENYSKETKLKDKIIFALLPSLKKYGTKKVKLFNYFSFKKGLKGDYLAIEGQEGRFMFFQCEGECQFIKREREKTNIYFNEYFEIPLFFADNLTVIGEELLFQK